MSKDERGPIGFEEALGNVMHGELAVEARKHEEMRLKREELRKAQNPKSMNATDLLGYRTAKQLADEAGEAYDALESEAQEAADKHEKENEINVASNTFPSPNIT